MHAAIYIRVSTEDQAERGVSLDAQRVDCTAWGLCLLLCLTALAHAHQPPGVEYKVFQFPEDRLPITAAHHRRGHQ